MTVTQEEDQGSVDLCPNCMGEVPAGDHFCKACMTPMDSFAATDPVRSIHAEFNVFNKASKGAPSFIVVLGMWLIWGPSVAVILVMLCYGGDSLMFSHGPLGINGSQTGGGILTMIVLVGLGGLFTAVGIKFLYCTTRNYLRARDTKEEEEDSTGEIGDEWENESNEV